MKIHFLLATSLLFFSSCIFISIPKPIPFEEITSFNSNSLDDLELKLATETSNLRIDIIRQTETEEDCEGDSETVNIPYHPLGFDLGNGLFFDFNNNLSFRIDEFLNIDKLDDFEISILRNQSESSIAKRDNKICKMWTGFLKKQREYCFDSIEYTLKGMKFFKRDRLFYEMTQSENETILAYNNRFSSPIRIRHESNYHFVLERRRRDENFFMDGNSVNLRDVYLVRKNETENLIEIYLIGRKKNFLQYRIKKSEGKVMVYSELNFGKKIDYSTTDVTVTHNNKVNPSSFFKRVK